jgi:hypothetical protein
MTKYNQGTYEPENINSRQKEERKFMEKIKRFLRNQYK